MDLPRPLKKLLSCSLCRRMYDPSDAARWPKDLNCRHTYCAGCLQQLAGYLKVTCPQCEQETELPAFGSLPTNEGLLFMLQQLPALQLGMAMMQMQTEQRLQPTSSRLAGRNWLIEVGLGRQPRGAHEHCNVHAMPNTTWCHTCQRLLCRVCIVDGEHHKHQMTRQLNMCDMLRRLIGQELSTIEERITYAGVLAAADMSLLRRLFEACDTVQQHVQRQLRQHAPTLHICHMRDWWLRVTEQMQTHGIFGGNFTRFELLRLLNELQVQCKKFHKQMLYIYRDCRLRASIREGGFQLLDFEQLHRRLMSLRQPPFESAPATVEPPPQLLLTNYCIYEYWCTIQRQLLPADLEEVEQLEEDAPVLQLQRLPLVQVNYPRMSTLWEGMSGSSSDSSNSRSSSVSSSSSDTPNNKYNNPAGLLFEDNAYNRLNLDQQLRTVKQRKDVAQPANLIFCMTQRTQSLQLTVESHPQSVDFDFDMPSTSAAAAAAAAAVAAAAVTHETVAATPGAVAATPAAVSAAPGAVPAVPVVGAAATAAAQVGLIRRPNSMMYPIYYLDMVMEDKPVGRVLIEVRNDVAPRMAENFRALILHERGFGYRGCSVFQACGDESIITGDFELQNGRGGYAAIDGGFFIPDNTGLPPKRGAVGMRRGQKRCDNSGSVGSQFRMVLYKRLPFSAIFGFIVDGIDVLDKIASTASATGRPAMCTFIKNCGEYRHNRI
ncbi:uncharacterized protein [Drosophila virilis]|uniref:uncharacterized protein n=1 Tax=Drosophila virilis TaxID=7244 RepID=UPI00017D5397|nr:uncharacterized protein LOC6632751 [Drosophila virilis]